MNLRRSLLARSAVVLTIVGFTPVPAAAATASPEAAAVGFAAAAATQRAPRGRQAAEPRTGPEVVTEVQAVLSATNTGCEVTNAVSPGQNGEINIYEVACANGLGHILSDGEQPTSRNCFIAAQQDQEARAENPDTPAQAVCSLPENANAEQVIRGYVETAGIQCQVADIQWIGRTQAGEDRYELDCATGDGYWLRSDRNGDFLGSLECIEVVAAGGQCALTTQEDRLEGLAARFASVAPQSCTAEDGRFVGANDEFRFYEVKCSEGFGFIGQTDLAGAAVSARDCGQRQIISGGCTLTDSSEARAAAAAQRSQALADVGRTCTINEERLVAVENPPDGSQGREIYEFDCGDDQPLGLMAFIPVEGGSGEFEAFDCIAMDGTGIECEFTSRETLNAGLTRIITASERNCDVSDFRVFARMADNAGDVIEVKCSDGRGWIGEFPFDRDQTGVILPCAAAERQGDQCIL